MNILYIIKYRVRKLGVTQLFAKHVLNLSYFLVRNSSIQVPQIMVNGLYSGLIKRPVRRVCAVVFFGKTLYSHMPFLQQEVYMGICELLELPATKMLACGKLRWICIPSSGNSNHSFSRFVLQLTRFSHFREWYVMKSQSTG